MQRPVFVLVVGLLTAAPGVARADLIDLGNGMIYDTVQDLTWLQDAAYVMTTGYQGVDAERQRLDVDPGLDGLFVWGFGAFDWVAQLEFGGFDDWRLPRYFGGGWEHGRSEMTVMAAQLGWYWYLENPDEPTSSTYHQGTTGPFVNWHARSVWLDDSYNEWNHIFGTDLSDPGSQSLAWAVRDGSPFRVPEPTSTLWLLSLGLGLTFARRARQRSGDTTQSPR